MARSDSHKIKVFIGRPEAARLKVAIPYQMKAERFEELLKSQETEKTRGNKKN